MTRTEVARKAFDRTDQVWFDEGTLWEIQMLLPNIIIIDDCGWVNKFEIAHLLTKMTNKFKGYNND